MTPRRLIATIWFAFALVPAMTATAFAQSAVDAVLEVMVRPVPRDGTPSRTRAWDINDRPKGQADSTYLFAGARRWDWTIFLRTAGLERGTESLCSAGSSDVNAGVLDDLVSRHLHVWKITSRAAGVTERGFAFDLEWVRYASATGTRPVASGRNTLILAEGQRHVLDLVHATGASAQCDAGSRRPRGRGPRPSDSTLREIGRFGMSSGWFTRIRAAESTPRVSSRPGSMACSCRLPSRRCGCLLCRAYRFRLRSTPRCASTDIFGGVSAVTVGDRRGADDGPPRRARAARRRPRRSAGGE